MKKYLLLVTVFFLAVSVTYAKGKDTTMENKAKKIIDEYVSKYEPLDIKVREAWYQYNTTGDKKASKREAEMQLAIRKLNSDKERFATLKDLYKQRKKITDPIIRREVEILYLSHLPNQVSDEKLKKLTELEKRLSEAFNDYRPEVDGKKLSPDEVDHILSTSLDSAKLEKVWKAKYKVAPLLENDYRELVKLRNSIARDLGYKNALVLAGEVAETDLNMLDDFYKDVVNSTDKAFKRLKEVYIDPRLVKRYGIKPSELRPWHYQNAYFQEAPNAIFGKVDLDSLYSKVDANKVIKQTIDFYGSMGVDIRGIIKNSSLFPKPGKNPHAVAWYLNPNKPDSAVLIMNLPNPPKPPQASEASTLVHELGHDINYESILNNKELPYLLKETCMLTEAFAMLMEQQTQTADWFEHLGVAKEKAQEAADGVELIEFVSQLVFLRWAANIYCFENAFYNNPDLDIGDTWWGCRERNQFLARPEGWKNPDALGKYHIPNVSPLYYSNYAIGSVANVQFAELFGKKIGDTSPQVSYFGKKQLGDWLMKDFLSPGMRYRWDDFLKMVTGKPLSVDAWKRKYIGSKAEARLYQ